MAFGCEVAERREVDAGQNVDTVTIIRLVSDGNGAAHNRQEKIYHLIGVA